MTLPVVLSVSASTVFTVIMSYHALNDGAPAKVTAFLVAWACVNLFAVYALFTE